MDPLSIPEITKRLVGTAVSREVSRNNDSPTVAVHQLIITLISRAASPSARSSFSRYKTASRRGVEVRRRSRGVLASAFASRNTVRSPDLRKVTELG